MSFDVALSRRRFLRASLASVAGLGVGAAFGPAFASAPRRGILPEHEGRLDELLFVYDQCAAPHLTRQVVEILRLAPPDARVHMVVSRARADEARQRMANYGFDAIDWVVADVADLSGLWPRDIFQIGLGEEGQRIVHVPWAKAATTREALEGTWRVLRPLERDDLAVRLLPIAGEGGNMVAHRGPRGTTLWAGSTIAVETRALTVHYWGYDPGDAGVARVLTEAFGVDAVEWVGPRAEDTCRRQSTYVFHVDMLLNFVDRDRCVVARCDPGSLDRDEHRERLEEEAARTIEALEEREARGVPWPDDLALPRDATIRGAFLDDRLREERAWIADAAHEMDAAAAQVAGRGCDVLRLDVDPRRVRRFQSGTNVVCARDRMLVPLFPTREHVHGWVLRRDGGRDSIDVDLGLQDSDFALTGDNLARVEFYRALHPNVRAVRDYFYLASGNVHCVVGRLS